MSYLTLSEAADAIGVDISTLIGQFNRLEHDVGEPLFHRATPNGRTQRPTRRGAALLSALSHADTQPVGADPSTAAETAAATPPTTLNGLPRDLLRAVHGQRSGWTRLERFAVTIAHPTIADAAAALGIERTTLLEQLHRLEPTSAPISTTAQPPRDKPTDPPGAEPTSSTSLLSLTSKTCAPPAPACPGSPDTARVGLLTPRAIDR